MAEKLAQDTALPGVTFEGGDFASLLQKARQLAII